MMNKVTESATSKVISAAAIASAKDSTKESVVGSEKFDEIKSPISLVHECALKRNLTVRFEVVKETGPPHMRTFVTKCIMGDCITIGEGNGKRVSRRKRRTSETLIPFCFQSSKKKAAENMIEQLKTMPPIASCHVPPKKKASSGSAAKNKKAKNLIKIEPKANLNYGQSINPISRLIQIQQAKKEKEPVYTLVAERGMPRRREFVMQVRDNLLPKLLIY